MGVFFFGRLRFTHVNKQRESATMTRKQIEAKKASNGSKYEFIERMGYDPLETGVPSTWKECVRRFK